MKEDRLHTDNKLHEINIDDYNDPVSINSISDSMIPLTNSKWTSLAYNTKCNKMSEYITNNRSNILTAIIFSISIINICLVFYFIGITAPVINNIQKKLDLVDPVLASFTNILHDVEVPLELIGNYSKNITIDSIEALQTTLSLISDIHRDSNELFTTVDLFIENLSTDIDEILDTTLHTEVHINDAIDVINITMINFKELVTHIQELITPPDDEYSSI